MKELIWNMFLKTGWISSYLLYKEIDNDGVLEEDEGQHKTCVHSGSGAAIH